MQVNNMLKNIKNNTTVLFFLHLCCSTVFWVLFQGILKCCKLFIFKIIKVKNYEIYLFYSNLFIRN